MKNTMRDRTEGHRDRDNTEALVVPPPQTPAAKPVSHVPGGATEMAEVNRDLQPATGGPRNKLKKRP